MDFMVKKILESLREINKFKDSQEINTNVENYRLL